MGRRSHQASRGVEAADEPAEAAGLPRSSPLPPIYFFRQSGQLGQWSPLASKALASSESFMQLGHVSHLTSGMASMAGIASQPRRPLPPPPPPLHLLQAGPCVLPVDVSMHILSPGQQKQPEAHELDC